VGILLLLLRAAGLLGVGGIRSVVGIAEPPLPFLGLTNGEADFRPDLRMITGSSDLGLRVGRLAGQLDQLSWCQRRLVVVDVDM
jgi:hypothetical protein